MAKKPQTRSEKEIKDFLTQHLRRLSNLRVKDLTEMQLKRYSIELKALERLAGVYGFLDIAIGKSKQVEARPPDLPPTPKLDESEQEAIRKMLDYRQGGDLATTNSES